MSTAAWCLVQDLVKGAPPRGQATASGKVREEWFVERLRAKLAEQLTTR